MIYHVTLRFYSQYGNKKPSYLTNDGVCYRKTL